MCSTYLSGGSLTKDQNLILKEQSNYYKRLFSTDENVEFNLENTDDKKISWTSV